MKHTLIRIQIENNIYDRLVTDSIQYALFIM